MKEPLFELMSTAAGLLTCGNSMTVTISLSIAKTNLPWLLPQREHDQFIMEALAALPEATRK
jgi:hypothetical protein